MSKEQHKYEKYREEARQTRRDVLYMTHAAGSGHPGGSMSSTELLVWLYNEVLEYDAENPEWDGRDRLVYSKGHACPSIYSVLARHGFFDEDELMDFRQYGGLLQGHSSRKIPGIEFSSGSLGQGLSFANGIALSAKLDDEDYGIYAFLGDGETQEGEVWEAAMTAGAKELDNLIAIVDRNGVQNDLPTEETKPIEPLEDKFESFRWHVIECDGHDFESIEEAFEEAKNADVGKPRVIIADTVKGNGISFMEEAVNGFHGKAPNDEELAQALRELGFDEDSEEVEKGKIER